jgi:hypothetical protein
MSGIPTLNIRVKVLVAFAAVFVVTTGLGLFAFDRLGALKEVSGTIGGVKQAATDTGAAAAQVLGAAGELSLHSSQLSTEVDEFLRGMKAA